MIGKLQMGGKVTARKITPPGPGLWWQLRNKVRPSFWLGWLAVQLAHGLTALTGIPTLTSELRLRLRKADGRMIDYGVVSRRVVTSAGVGFIVDAWQNLTELENMKYHGCGTGTTAEASGDTALVTESTTALNPDSTRATGTQTEPASNQVTSTGTLTFDASAAVTEHGLFSQAATGGGVLFDRSVFSAINVVSGDSIQFAYTLTLTAGG